MDREEITGSAERYTEAWCSLTAARVAEHYAPDASLTINDGESAVGRAAIARAAQGFYDAFPDMKVFLDDLVVGDDAVEFHWTFTGTNTGIGGSGNAVRITGYEEWTIGPDGLIAPSHGHDDQAEYARQLEHGV